MEKTPRTQKVYLEAEIGNVSIGHFGERKQNEPLFKQFIAVELTDAELKLPVHQLIEAARQAILRTLKEQGRTKIRVYNGGCNLDETGQQLNRRRQVLALEQDPENVKLSGRWVTAA